MGKKDFLIVKKYLIEFFNEKEDVDLVFFYMDLIIIFLYEKDF